MNERFSRPFAMFLCVILIAPSVFLVVPQRAYALGGFSDTVHVITDTSPTSIKRTVESTISAIKNTLTAIHTFTSATAEYAQFVNTYVLEPLAFVLSGKILKALTAAVVAFVVGKTNGTGIPQFVVDVQRSLRTVSDSQALAFIQQFGQNSNSPFASSISASLKKNYLQATSLEGFWDAYRCSIYDSTPNVDGFLRGDWSQGGIAAWFALTTQPQNNPYTLYLSSQEQIVNLVGSGAGGATGARLAELTWGSGFLSWCGDIGSSYTPGAYTTIPADRLLGLEGEGGSDLSGSVTVQNGINPGDPCVKGDGTFGSIKTPGSVIVASLNKVLGGEQDQVVRMGNVGPEINAILGDVATVMRTVGFASQILGGDSGSGSGGLAGIGNSTSSGGPSPLDQYRNSQGNMGLTESRVREDQMPALLANSDMSARLPQYRSAWTTIRTAADTASTSVASLRDYCTSQAQVARDLIRTTYGSDPERTSTLTDFISASTALAEAALVALSDTIAPVLSQAAAADTIATTAADRLSQIQAESGDPNASSGAYATDIQSLQMMPPTDEDLGDALLNAQSFGTASSTPNGSLSVSGDSLTDEMNLIRDNAEQLENTCDIPDLTTTNDTSV